MNAHEATLLYVDEFSRMAEAYDRNVVPRFEAIAQEVLRLAKCGTGTPSEDVPRLRGASQPAPDAPEAAMLGNPAGVRKGLSNGGFDRTEAATKSFPIQFRDLDELLTFTASFGWPERELREMSAEQRDGFRTELAARLGLPEAKGGIEDTWSLNFFSAFRE